MTRWNIAKAIAGSLLAVGVIAPSLAQNDIEAALPSPDDAPIAMLYDLQSGRTLFARDTDRRFAPASITKVMTTYVAFDKLRAGDAAPKQQITIRPETFAAWSRKGSTMYLAHDAVISVDELLHGITTVSANDASVVLAEGLSGSVGNWLGDMNAKAAEIGMNNTHFATPNGWPDEGATFTTARDLTLLGSALLRDFSQEYQHFYGKRTYSYNGITQDNHDPITGRVAGADGIKTGYTNQAGFGFLGTAERGGRRLIMVIAASNRNYMRNRAARGLMEWGFAATRNERLFAPGAIVANIAVQNGESLSVPVTRAEGIFASLAKGETMADTQVTIRYRGPVQAPIAQGETVAWLSITPGTGAKYEVPLVAARGVARANPVERLRNGLAGWFS